MWPFRKREPTAEENAAEMVIMLFETERDKWEGWMGPHTRLGYRHSALGCTIYREMFGPWEGEAEGQRLILSPNQVSRIISAIDRKSDEVKLERIRSFAQKIIDRAA